MTVGDEAESRRERFLTARESDPDAGGFGTIFSRGPQDLIADPAAAQRFFGETTV